MPAVARIDPKDVFTPEEWAPLSRAFVLARADARGRVLGAHLRGGRAVRRLAQSADVRAGVMLIGARQLGLAILMHDAAHGALHSNQKINDWVGEWLCAAPVGARLESYRAYHLKHHRYTEQPEDPDLALSAPFPITRASALAQDRARSHRANFPQAAQRAIVRRPQAGRSRQRKHRTLSAGERDPVRRARARRLLVDLSRAVDRARWRRGCRW